MAPPYRVDPDPHSPSGAPQIYRHTARATPGVLFLKEQPCGLAQLLRKSPRLNGQGTRETGGVRLRRWCRRSKVCEGGVIAGEVCCNGANVQVEVKH